MLYRLDKEVDWITGKSDLEEEIKNEIQKLREKYFGDNTKKTVRLIYPKGAPEEVHKVFGVLKKYQIDLKSPDGVWRWSRSRPKLKNGELSYDDHHFPITHSTIFREKDIDFIWFLVNKAAPVKSGKVYIENLEEEADKEINTIQQEVDIDFALLSSKSPISKDAVLLKQVAKIFGVRDVDKISLSELKLALRKKIIDGERNRDPFINFTKFDELTSGETKRKHAYTAYRAIEEGFVGWKGRKWYLMYGRDFGEELFDMKASEVPDRNNILVEMVVNDPNIRARVFQSMNEDEITTAQDLRELQRPVLQKILREETGEFDNKYKIEDLVERICKHRGIDYEKP